MASGAPPPGGPARAVEPAGGDGVWHSTCGSADCADPSRYAADSTCKGCRRIKYCTIACQKADWKRHKSECKADAAADEAAAREGALVAPPRARTPPPEPRLLLKAAMDGNVRTVEALLQLGADANAANSADMSRCTPLHWASKHGHAAVVTALLTAPGIAVNAALTNGSTPLHLAALEGHAAVAAALLAAPGVDVNEATALGDTPLLLASQMGHAAVVAALLRSPGVAVNAAKEDGATPLFCASQEGQRRLWPPSSPCRAL